MSPSKRGLEGASGERDLSPEAVAAPEDAMSMGHRHVRGSALLTLGRGLALVFTVSAQVILIRYLTPIEFGSFIYALSLAMGGRVLLSLGQGKMLSRFAAIYEEEKDYSRMFGSIVLAIGTVLVTSPILLLSVAFSAGWIAGPVDEAPGAASVVLILMFLAPMVALDQVFISLFAVFSEPRSIFFRKYLLTPVLRLIVVVALVSASGTAVMLAIGYVAAQVVGTVVAIAILIRLLRERGLLHHFHPRGLIFPFRAVFSFSLPSLTTELANLSKNSGTVVLLGAIGGAAQVAVYRAVWPAAHLNQFVFSTFTALFVPMTARLFARGDHEGTKDSYWHSAIVMAVFSFPVFAMTAIFAPATTVLLFGERYASSAPILTLIAAGYYFNVVLGFNSHALTVYGRIRYLVCVNAFVATLNIALTVALVPSLGPIGAGIANCAMLVAQNLLNQIALRTTIGTAFIDRRYIRPYLLVAAAVGILVLTRVAFSPGILGSLLATSIVSLALLLAARDRLGLGDTFPELLRVPGLGRLLK